MSQPRPVIPGSFYMVSRRCTQRQLLLRPDELTNRIFLFCLFAAAKKYGIEVILPTAMSNHYHAVVFDRLGTINEFTAYFHKLVAKAVNAHRGRCENMWSAEPPSVVRLTDRNDVLAKLLYTAINPVKDGLVDRVHHWPGVSGLSALLAGRTLEVRRPPVFFRADGEMPEHVTYELVIPPELGDAAEIRRQLRELVAAAEKNYAEARHRACTRVLGRRRVLRQSWRDYPTSEAPRGGLNPRVAARNTWARVEALQRNREFINAYRKARRDWLAGLDVEFPYGTYWLRRFANVRVAAPPDAN